MVNENDKPADSTAENHSSLTEASNENAPANNTGRSDSASSAPESPSASSSSVPETSEKEDDPLKVEVVPPSPESGEIAEPGSEPSVPGKSSLNSAVTTDLANTPEQKEAAEKAQAEAERKAEEDQSFEGRASRAGIGLVKVDGIDHRYVGIAPARENGESVTPGGTKIGCENSTFTPLSQVPFNPSIRIKDPASGEYYFPKDGITSWDAVELEGSYLVPRAE